MSSNPLPKTSGIYAIRKDGITVYIGSAKNFRQRWDRHKSELNKDDPDNPHHNEPLQRSWRKYGEDAFEFVVIDRVPVALLLIREQLHMNLYPDSYNILRVAGSPLGYKHTDEAREKNRQAALGNQHCVGRVLSPETKARISEAMMGHEVAPETREKIGEANRGRVKSPETLERMRRASTGHKHTEESKEKMRQANTGRKHTDEAKAKISEAGKARWARKRAAEATDV